MPLSGLAEIIIQPVAELVIQVAGYATAWVVLPLGTFGFLHVESIPFREFVKPGIGRIKKLPTGAYLIEAELASLLGLIIWGIGVGVYVYIKHT